MPHTHRGDRLRNRYIRALDRDEETGRTAEDTYLERARAFDPHASARRSSMAVWEDIRDDLGEDIGELRGEQVGMGRLDTGFATEDEDRLVRGATDELDRVLAANAMRATRMDLANTQGIGRHGRQVTNRYLHLLSGERDREMMEENARRRRRGAIGGLLGTGLGALAGTVVPGIGNWAGAKIGATIGGSLGGAAGSLY